MQDPCLKSFPAALELAESTIRMADHNEAHCNEDGSLLDNAVIRDWAHRSGKWSKRNTGAFNHQTDETPRQVNNGARPNARQWQRQMRLGRTSYTHLARCQYTLFIH